MGDQSAIEWTEATWNPLVGCSRVSEGCRHCYAERVVLRVGSGKHKATHGGLVKRTNSGPRWTGEVRLIGGALELPLRWTRPRRIFVNSLSDLFHEKVPDEWIASIFGVMAASPQHTFQVLTKRPERMLAWFAWLNDRGGLGPYIRSVRVDGDRTLPNLYGPPVTEVYRGKTIRATRDPWMQVFNAGACIGAGPLPDVWLGVSVEDQATADARIPLLLQTPAAVRWVSYEPALGPVDFGSHVWRRLPLSAVRGSALNDAPGAEHGERLLNWIVVGGESGPGARPFDLAWARQTIAQCRAAGVPVFVKQVGGQPRGWCPWRHHDERPPVWLDKDGVLPSVSGQPPHDLCHALDESWWSCSPRLRDRKGGDPAEWPEDLRVREYPTPKGVSP